MLNFSTVRLRTTCLCVIAVVCVSLSLSSDALGSYEIKTLGDPGRVSTPIAINDNGDVVVDVSPANDFILPGTAFLLRSGTRIDLIGLGGSLDRVADIDSYGNAVGTSYEGAPFTSNNGALIWNNNGTRTLIPNSTDFIVYGINDQGSVIGRTASGPFLYRQGLGTTNLASQLGLNGNLRDINNNGVMVGSAELPEEIGRIPIILEGNNLIDLGFDAGSTNAINELGQATGYAFDGNRFRAFFYDPLDGISFLDDLESRTSGGGINDYGVIVGAIQNPGSSDAFIYDENGFQKLIDLIPSNSGWQRIITAYDINNSGQIIGQGILNGELRGYLITPVPEPSTACIAASFIIMAATLRISVRQDSKRL